MNHSRSTTRFAALCALLALSGMALWLPQRGFAQAAAGGAAAQNGPTDGAASGYRGAGDGQNGDNGTTNSYGDNSNGDNSNGGNSDTNGGDSAIGRNGEALPNPRVGVDTNGRNDATATRNGRTTRRRSMIPNNPIAINNSQRGTGDTLLDTDNRASRLPFPVPSREPGDYTLPADPTTFGSRRYTKPLPLFGYDFFQPARQIILARRRALLPRPPQTNQRNSRTRNNSRSRNSLRLRTGSTPGTATGNGSDLGSDQGNNDNNGNDQNSSNDQNNGNGQNNNDQNNNNNSSDQNNGYTDQNNNGNDQNNNGSDLTGLAVGAAAIAAGSRARTQDGNGADTTDYNTGNLADQAAPNSRALRASDSNQPGENSTDMGDAGASGDMVRRRRAATDTNGTISSSPDMFSGDTAMPGSDIQFPGDDALLQGNATNAVTGEIADPVATLYRNVLTSLPPNYQLQPGDSLTVRYSALTIAPREFTTTVDVQGGISVPEVGRISVAGRTASQAEDTLRQRLERLYRNVDVSISLRQLRTIQVTVSGAAFAPGTYNDPGDSDCFQCAERRGRPDRQRLPARHPRPAQWAACRHSGHLSAHRGNQRQPQQPQRRHQSAIRGQHLHSRAAFAHRHSRRGSAGGDL